MNINPFENIKNEYELENLLERGKWGDLDIKEQYCELFDEFDYSLLVKSINTKIKWHILTTGGCQGDYWYIGEYNDKFYFLDVGYGSCSVCDNFMASDRNVDDLKSLQDALKREIREFESLEELTNWIINCTEWWLNEKDEILDFIKKEFNYDII